MSKSETAPMAKMGALMFLTVAELGVNLRQI